jgi:hypothetical protein
MTVVSATNPNWDAKGYNLTNLNLTPTSGTDAATKNYVDIQKANDTKYISVVSITNPNWDAKGYNLTNLNLTPTSGTDAATKNYVDIQKANDTSYPTKQIAAANDTQRIKGGIARLAAIKTIVGTSATAITGLSFPIAAMETVQFDSLIRFGSTGINGTLFSITIPSGAINATMFCPVIKTGLPSTFNQSTIVASATAPWETCNHEVLQNGWVTLSGTVQNAGTDGTVQFNTQNKRASTLVVNASSYVKWNRLDGYTAGGT